MDVDVIKHMAAQADEAVEAATDHAVDAPAASATSIVMVQIADIKVPETHRAVDPAKVKEIAGSMAKIGLQHAITVTNIGVMSLVAGAHRLQGAISLGWTEIACICIQPMRARLWTISENLHRADLSVLERAEAVAEWIRLTEDRNLVSGQVGQKLPGRPEGGIAKAARDLTVLGDTEESRRKVVGRSVAIASISPDAKAVAEAEGLQDNQQALLEIAKEPTPDTQVDKAKALAAKRKTAAAGAKKAKKPKARATYGEKVVKQTISQQALAEFRYAVETWFTKMDPSDGLLAIDYVKAAFAKLRRNRTH